MQIENAAIEGVKSQIETLRLEQEKEEEKERQRLEQEKETLRLEEEYENMKTNIEKTAMDAIVRELDKIQIKNATSMVTSNFVNDTLTRASNNIVVTDNIKRSSIDAVTAELMAAIKINDLTQYIQKTAINAVNKELNMYETRNLASNYANDIMNETMDKILDNTTLINSIKQTAINAVSSELTKTQIKDVVPTDETSDIKYLEKQLLDMIDDFQATNKIFTDEQSKKITDKTSTEGRLKEKDEQISELLSTISPEDLANLEKNEEVKQKLDIYKRNKIDAVPLGSDIESSIENVAKNEVNENIVKRDLEEVAKTEVKNIANESQATATEVTDVQAPTTVNIENDLRNAALVAIYRALLEVPREPREPIDITKPPSNYDVLITDKTYRYDEKTGKRKEIPELTKYDSILAK